MMQNYYSQPYYQYQTLSGRMIDNFGEVTANDVPMDGSIAIFPKRDMSEIQIRRWMPNGQISTNSYRPVIANPEVKQSNTPYTSLNAENGAILGQISDLNDKIDKLIDKLDRRGKNECKSDSKSNDGE